jgi:hypothetical protein
MCHSSGATLAPTGTNRAPDGFAHRHITPLADPSGVRGSSL